MNKFTIQWAALIAFLLCLFSVLAYGTHALDRYIEPPPVAGDIWLPNFEPSQPYWPTFWDTEVLEVRGGFVRYRSVGSEEISTVFDFHTKYNPKRP
jgi:hypothetical protein